MDKSPVGTQYVARRLGHFGSVISRSLTSDDARSIRNVIAAMLAFCAAVLPLSAPAQQPVETFYKDKTIDLYIGYSAGGGYDAYARLVARHMGDHIPGAPRIVPQNMPGAGSRIAASYVYSVAPHDGTALGTADQALALEQVTGDKSIAVRRQQAELDRQSRCRQQCVVRLAWIRCYEHRTGQSS